MRKRKKPSADLMQRMVGLLESAAEYASEFDESRKHDPDNDEAGDQYAYGVATGLFSAVAGMVVTEENGFLTFGQWMAIGCPTDPFALLAVRQ